MSFGYFGGGGRWSPWGRQPPPVTPTVQDDNYSYISQDDILDPPSRYGGRSGYYGDPLTHTQSRRRPQPDSDDEGPDILNLKHKANHYPLQFPAYSISEGRLRVSEVRRAAADKLGANPRRIKLLYKGRQLKDNAVAANEEGLKQNSEVTCIVSEAMNDPMSSSEDESASEAEMRAAEGYDMPRQTAGRRNKGREDEYRRPNDSRREHSRDSGARLDVKREPPKRDTSATPARPTPVPSPSVFDSSLPSKEPPPAALKQISDLEAKYRNELAGPCERLLSRPPSDAKARDYEIIRLTETIERDILLKTDAIETDGKEELRAKRKALVKEVQTMLKRLDAAKESWKKESSS